MGIERRALKVSEFAEALGLGRSKGYAVVASGAVKSVRIGGCLRVLAEDVDAYIGQLRAENESAPTPTATER